MSRLDDFSDFSPEQQERLRAVLTYERRKTRNVALACVAVLLWDAVVCVLFRWWFG